MQYLNLLGNSHTMRIIKKIFRWSLRKCDKFLLQLCRQGWWWLVLPLSGIARAISRREFFPRETNYATLGELRQLVVKAMHDQAAGTVHDSEEECISPGLKVLLIFNIGTSFEDAFVKTARGAGFDVDTFYANTMSYLSPDSDNLENMRTQGRELLRKVQEFKPQLILLDVNYLGNANTINNNLIQEIKKIHSCKIAGFMGDYYSKEGFHIAEYWSDSLDVILHGVPGMSSGGLQNFHYMPYFVNEKTYYPASKKGKDITFSGSGRIPRYVYLAFAKSFSKKRGYDCEIVVHSHDSSALTLKDYSRLVRESRAVLDLTASPAPGASIHTSRMLEAIASKSLLIEEKSEITARLFTPYAHFIPFDSKKELAIAIDFSVRSAELVEKITDAAYKKYRLEHSSKAGWNRIVRLCRISAGGKN